MSFIPDDETLLAEIRRLQDIHGSGLGLPKIHEYIKAEHSDWCFGVKRLRAIRKDHALAPSPPSSSKAVSSSLVDAPQDAQDMLKLHLNFRVPDASGRSASSRTFRFLDDIPAALCQPGVPRDITSVYLSRLIDARETEILQKGNWTCVYCGEAATAFYGVPAVTLVDRPPTVNSLTQPLCSLRSQCARMLFAWAQNALQDPEFGKGKVFSVHHCP